MSEEILITVYKLSKSINELTINLEKTLMSLEARISVLYEILHVCPQCNKHQM